MQSASDEKAILELKTKLAELEQLIGQKQIEVEFYKKMVDMAEDDYDIDIKKNFSTRHSDTFGCNESNTPSA